MRPEELAEDTNAHVPLRRGMERLVRPGFVLWLGTEKQHPEHTVALRFRLGPDEVAPAVEEIRAALRERGRPNVLFEVGPSATPGDLFERLLDLGVTVYDPDPIVTGMVLRQPLRETTYSVTARQARTVDDYVAGYTVLNQVFRERVETPEQRRARAEEELQLNTAGRGAFFLAEAGGEVVAAAAALHLPDAVVLSGGATLPAARGKGAYRALVAARYAAAVARGTPVLVIQASGLSAPILGQIGFEAVARIRILVGTSTGSTASRPRDGRWSRGSR